MEMLYYIFVYIKSPVCCSCIHTL